MLFLNSFFGNVRTLPFISRTQGYHNDMHRRFRIYILLTDEVKWARESKKG